jgi:hypothetical protein
MACYEHASASTQHRETDVNVLTLRSVMNLTKIGKGFNCLCLFISVLNKKVFYVLLYTLAL